MTLALTSASILTSSKLRPCIPFQRCPHVLKVIELVREDKIPPSFDRVNIIRTLMRLTRGCGWIRDPQTGEFWSKVRCPPAFHLKGDRSPRDKNDEDKDCFKAKDLQESVCHGRLDVIGLNATKGFSGFTFTRRRDKLRDDASQFETFALFNVKASGDCCWKLYEASYRLGKAVCVDKDFDGHVLMDIKSVDKVKCEDD